MSSPFTTIYTENVYFIFSHNAVAVEVVHRKIPIAVFILKKIYLFEHSCDKLHCAM